MTFWSTILGFSAASFVIAISPGPSWIYVISTTLRHGRRAGLVAVMGNGCGILCHVLAAGCGLSALLNYSAWAYATVKFAGAIYLIYLGLRMLRRPPVLVAGSAAPTPAAHRIVFREALVVSLLNPKLAVLMFALLPQFVNPALGNTTLQTIGIGSLHFLIASVVLSSLVQIASRSAAMFQPSPMFRSVVRYIGGSFLIALGIRVALAGRP